MNIDAVFLLKDGQPSGPYAVEVVRTMVANGEVKRQDPAWRQGLASWSTLEQLVGFDDLPPLPAQLPGEASPPSRPAWLGQGQASRITLGYPPLATISGGLGLLLLLLMVFSIGSCSSAQHDLEQFVSASNSPEGAAELFLRGFNRGLQGDPLGTAFDHVDAERALETQADDAQLQAWLCVIGVAVCGVFFFLASRKPAKAP